MGQEEIFHLPCTDPQFLDKVFHHLLASQRAHPLVTLFDLENEAHLSALFDLSGVQDSFLYRGINRARRLSLALITEKGEVDRERLKEFIRLLEKEGSLFYPRGLNDGAIHAHFVKVLKDLDNDLLLKTLKKFQRPLCHKWAETLIFQTLGIDSTSPPTDAQIRSAVLCACLTPLRQNVGSCFATAPAILIQREQLPLLLDDLLELLSTGKLKRTFGGIEYALPMSPSTGIADLRKNLLPLEGRSLPGFCPGLTAALEAGGLLDPSLSWEEKGRRVQAEVERLATGKTLLTAEEVIHTLLSNKFSLTEEDLERAESIELTQYKRSKLSFPPSSQKAARKEEQILSFLDKEKSCRTAFKRICDNALLRAWEFTLASFSEVKMEFSRWNLYSSLGFSPREPGGIGELLYHQIDGKIQEINKKLEVKQKEYEIAFDQVRGTELLLRNAGSESDARRLQAEYQSRAYHMRACLEARDTLHAKGTSYSRLFSLLLKEYDKRFPEYFQEIYDAQMQDFQGDLYDDRPAGFRLVYKHGRPDPSLWTLIYNAHQYTDALVDFFSATEPQIVADCGEEGKGIAELTSSVIAHVQSEVFLESALQRMAAAHQTPLASSPLTKLNLLEKKPWAYTSGGTMTTLLKTYYRRESELSCEEKWVESETELLIFILDALKALPPKITDPFRKDPQVGMLMNSPSHAFVLLPGVEELAKGWQEEIFTYTWVRDALFLPGQEFYAEMPLNAGQQELLFSAFCEQLPPLLGRHLAQTVHLNRSPCTVQEWRNQILLAEVYDSPNLAVRRIKSPKQKQLFSDRLDAFLYCNLPIVPGQEWKAIVRRILSDLGGEKLEEVLRLFPDVPAPLLTAQEIKEIAKGCYLLAEKKITLALDLHRYVAKHARFIGAAPPTPLLFADTNWAGNYFGFIVNPGTGRLELWRLDSTASQGVPMSEWKHWLNGLEKKNWSIFTRPYEYH